MTEREFFNKSILDHIVDHDRILSGVDIPQAKHRHGAKRALLLIAACFLCVFVTIACIPKARAEVLSWFGWSTTPGDYLGEDPQAREPVEPMEAIIKTADLSGESGIVTNAGELGRISELLTQRLNVSPLETLYDGDSIYVSMKLGNGFGVWLLENYTGGTIASVAISPDQLGAFFDHAVPDEYLTGKTVYYSHTFGQLVFTLPDGSVFRGDVRLANAEAYASLLNQIADDPERVNEQTEAFLAKQDIIAYAALKADPETLLSRADESGCILGKLSLLLQNGAEGSKVEAPVTVLEADIGGVSVNVATYRSFSETASVQSVSAEWTGEAVLTSYDDSEVAENTYGYVTFTNHALNLDGLKMKALSVKVDATGIKDIQVEVTYPDHWSEEDIRAFAGSYGIRFRLLINGQAGDWTVNGSLRSSDTQDARKRVWHCRAAYQVPLGLLPQIKELTLIPYISYRTAYYELLPDQTGERRIRGEVTPLLLDQPFRIWNEFYGDFDTSVTEYMQYALTFSIPGDDSGAGE